MTPNPGGLQGVLNKRNEVFGPPPYHYWGTHKPQNYSPDVTGRITQQLVRASAMRASRSSSGGRPRRRTARTSRRP